jgi:spermidine synthase
MSLKITVFICGAAVMIIEILGSRLLAPAYGSSITVWTSIIGVVLAFLSLGYHRGGILADKNPGIDVLAGIISKTALFTILIPIINVFFTSILSSPSDILIIGPVLSSLAVLAIPSYLFGLISPYAIKLSLKEMHSAGKVSGNLYAISTVGSIAGTFLTGFFLIPHFRITTIIYALAMLLAFVSLCLRGRRMLYDFLTVLLIAIILISYFPSYSAQTVPSASREYSRILWEKESHYNLILVKEADDERIIQIGITIQSGVNTTSGEGIAEYMKQIHFAWLLNPNIEKVAALGCGAGVIPRDIHRNYPKTAIDVVDIDSDVFYAADNFFGLREDERMIFNVGDARAFIKNSEDKYDLIVMDVYSSTYAIPNHLVTKEMMMEMKKHLTEEGVVYFNVISSLNESRSLFLRSMYKTIRQVFPTVYLIPTDENNSNRDFMNIVLFATNSDKRYSKEELIAIKDSYNRSDYINDKLDKSLNMLQTEDVNQSGAIVFYDDYAPVDYMLFKNA